MLFKKLALFLVILSGFFCCKIANAQLWSYIGDTPAKEKAFDKYLKKEAYKVIAHHTSDEFKAPYDEIIYRLQSLDSILYYIHIMQVPFSNKNLTITTSTDSLNIEDCMGPARLHLLRKNLFEIVYSPRGGSDDGYDNVLLLAVRNGKFIISMEIETMHNYDGPGFFDLDETHLSLTGENPQNYRLTLKEHDRRRDDNKTKNYDHYLIQNLKYDDKLNIFYTSNETINGWIWTYDDNDSKIPLKGTFPVIKLGDLKYCFVNDCWYSVGKDFQSKKTILYSDCQRPKAKI